MALIECPPVKVMEILYQESTAHLEKLAGEQMPKKRKKYSLLYSFIIIIIIIIIIILYTYIPHQTIKLSLMHWMHILREQECF